MLRTQSLFFVLFPIPGELLCNIKSHILLL
nr:MAG TPA: hypothetical protein [Caudoviricetes sp.]